MPVPLLDGEYIDNAQNDSSLANVAPGTGVDAADYEYSYQQINTGVATTTSTSSQNSTWYGTTTYYQTNVVTTPKKNINTNSIRADRAIKISFTGYDEGAPQQSLSVVTEGNLLINGTITNSAGPTTLTSTGGSIEQENAGAAIGGKNITLSAATGIGVTDPVLLNLTNASSSSSPNPGVLNATSINGNINIDDVSGSLTIGNISTSPATGNVTLTADESLFAASASSLVKGGSVNLTASFGTVGTLGTGGTANAPAGNAAPVVVNVGTADANNLKVNAQGDVFVRQSAGDLRLYKIASTAGNVRVEVPSGSLIDANNVSVPDTQNLAELEARWNSMLATQSTAQISLNSTINAFENQIDQEYQTYWTFRDEQPDPSVFDPTFQVTLPAGQLAAWTTYYTNVGSQPPNSLSGAALTTFVNNAITTLENADTQEYRTFNTTFGKLGSSYNPDYRYYANQTPLNGNASLTFTAASLDSTGYLLNLPGSGYVTGQVVVYHANGGSVGGLTSGSQYYVIVDPADSNQISLASSYADATAATPVPIHLSSITGSGNALANVFASPNMGFTAASVDNTGYLISLPGNSYTTGQAVVYHANGGSVGGLTDGQTYYVIVSTANPNEISLASSYTNAASAIPVPIQLTSVTGSGNALSEIFQTFGAANVDASGLSIDLPQNVFTTGEAVVYHANGGSVGGLTDGGTYYVVVDPNNTGNSAYIGLASSAANATAGTPTLIHLTGITGTGHYLSEVDVESERAAWSQSQLQNSLALSIVEPALFPSTVQAIPDPNIEGINIAIVVSNSIGSVSGMDTIALPLTAALPQNEALDLAAAQPADITFYNAGPNNTLVAVLPTNPAFNPVELTVSLQKGVSLENTGVVDATAGQNVYLESGQDVTIHGPILPIKIDHIVAKGGVSAPSHPDGVVRVIGLDGLVNGATSGINITSGNLFLEGGNTGGIGTSIAPLYIDLAPGSLLEEANAEYDVDIWEKNGDLGLVTAFSAAGNVNLTADKSILNGNLFNDVNVEAHNISLTSGADGDTTNTIGTSSAPLEVVLTGGSVVAQAYEDVYIEASSGDLTVGDVHSLHGDLFLSSPFGSILEPDNEPVGTAVAIASNITLMADPLLGFIGSSNQAFEIDAIAPGTLTASSGQSAFITQPVGDLYLNTVTISNGGTAFIVASDGNIYNGNPGGENVLSGKTYLFASLNIGTSSHPLATSVGNVQGQSTTGSTFLVNSGALTVGGVVPNNAMGMVSGGTIDVVAMSPITIIQNVNAVGDVMYLSTHDATSGDMVVAAGVTIESTTGSILLQAGDDFTLNATSSLLAPAPSQKITIIGDYGNLLGVGSVITINGSVSAPTVAIDENGANAIVNLNNLSGINNAMGQTVGLLTVTGGTGNNQLIVNDSADTQAKTGVLTASTVTGLGIGGSGISYSNLSNNQTNPPFTAANQPFSQNLEILLGTGADVFSVHSTNATTLSLVENTGTQQDQIDVSSTSPQLGGIVNNIQGGLTVQGNGQDEMTVDDTGSTNAKTATLTQDTLTGMEMGPLGITYSGLAILNIYLGAGGTTGNTFNIAVADGQNLPPTTNIHAGANGHDKLNASWAGDYNGSLGLTGFGLSNIAVGHNFNGTLTSSNPGAIQSISIGGSLTATGKLYVINPGDEKLPQAVNGLLGDIGMMTVGGSIAGLVSVTGNITTLIVGPALNTPTQGDVNDLSGKVIAGGAITTASISGNISGLIQTSFTINSLYIGESLQQSGVVAITNQSIPRTETAIENINTLTVGADVAGNINVGGTLFTSNIGGSVTHTGVIVASSVNTMAIVGDMAGQLVVSGALDTLTVGGGTPGTIIANQIGTIGVSAGYGPIVAQIEESGTDRLIEATTPAAPFPTPPPPPAPTPSPSPAGITFRYFYEGELSPSIEGLANTTNLGNPQLTIRVSNHTASTAPDQFDLSLITDNDAQKFNLARLDASGNSGVSGIRNVDIEGDLLTSVTAAALRFFGEGSSLPGIYLPQDNLASVSIRDYAPRHDIAARSIQAIAFGSTKNNSNTLETGSNASAGDAAALLASGTAIVQAGSVSGSTAETFRVAFADISNQQVGFFMDDTPGAGVFDNTSVTFTVEGTLTPNASGTANIVTQSNTARGAVVALVTVAETFNRNHQLNNSFIETINLHGDGGSISTQQMIGTSSSSVYQPVVLLTPLITSTGPLGDVNLQGAMPSVTAPSIFGSIIASGSMPVTSIIQTTGIRIDPITGATSDVPADIGQLYVTTTPAPTRPNLSIQAVRGDSIGPISPSASIVNVGSSTSVITDTVIQASGTGIAGQIIAGGNLISQVVANGGITGEIVVEPVAWEPTGGNLGATFTYNSSHPAMTLGGVVSNGPMGLGMTAVTGNVQGGTITTYGSVLGNITINGPLVGPSISVGINRGTFNVNGPILAGLITTYGSVVGNITINGPVTGPSISLVSNTGTINFNGPVEGGDIVTYGSVTGTITINGPVSGPSFVGGSSAVTLAGVGPIEGGVISTKGAMSGSIVVAGGLSGATFTGGSGGTMVNVTVPVQGAAILTGGTTAGNISVGGPLSGQIVSIGDLNGNVAVSGPVLKGGLIATSGTLNGNVTVAGPFSGNLLSVGNINGNVTIQGPMKSGRIASRRSILGNLTVNGDIDSASAIVAGGSIGGSNGKLSVGNVSGIIAAVGSIKVGKIGSTSSAVFYQQNDAIDAAVIDAIFTQGILSPLSPTDLFDHSTLLDLDDLSQISTNLDSLTVIVGPNNKKILAL